MSKFSTNFPSEQKGQKIVYVVIFTIYSCT